MKVRNMINERGVSVPNQIIFIDDNGNQFFQSYETVIAMIDKNGNVSLDENKWDFSSTTGKYRNRFLNEDKKTTTRKINSGEYTLKNLNQ
jgi:hypothetical protein